jgi:hypothetical protein
VFGGAPGTVAEVVGEAEEVDQLIGVTHRVAQLLPPRATGGGVGEAWLRQRRGLGPGCHGQRVVVRSDPRGAADQHGKLSAESHLPLAKFGSRD